MRRTTIFAIAVLLLSETTMSAHAATITVTNTNDSGLGSLRQALRDANDGDTINFAVTGAITLTSGGLPVNKADDFSPGKDQLSMMATKRYLCSGFSRQNGSDFRPDHQERSVWDFERRHGNRHELCA
jgi:hypothetical protein